MADNSFWYNQGFRDGKEGNYAPPENNLINVTLAAMFVTKKLLVTEEEKESYNRGYRDGSNSR